MARAGLDTGSSSERAYLNRVSEDQSEQTEPGRGPTPRVSFHAAAQWGYSMNMPMWSVRFLSGKYRSARIAAPDRATACLLILAETGVEVSASRDLTPAKIAKDVKSVHEAPPAIVACCGRIDVSAPCLFDLKPR